ncbi:unnamed protein product [Nippostrongylus brasiliensis]|uniref:Peptidase S74 domain-containing protein n=1 Tax=Nippostrongylus brasiliensis TaxID=27835 RepID=A0A0N4XI24_NIPBR|nr:unnamed protein product [Nippostrongylus brasiliensis]
MKSRPYIGVTLGIVTIALSIIAAPLVSFGGQQLKYKVKMKINSLSTHQRIPLGIVGAHTFRRMYKNKLKGVGIDQSSEDEATHSYSFQNHRGRVSGYVAFRMT